MIARLLDRLFGKRYVDGWPRGVKPCFPGIAEHFKAIDAELWEETHHLPLAQALRTGREYHPVHVHRQCAKAAGYSCTERLDSVHSTYGIGSNRNCGCG